MSNEAADWEYPSHKTWERVPALDEVDPEDRKAVLLAREQKIRDDWIRVMEARIIREKLIQCYRSEGVNHYQNCRHLADLYLTALKTGNVEGFRKMQSVEKKNASDGADGQE